jgi:hypothetical protein
LPIRFSDVPFRDCRSSRKNSPFSWVIRACSQEIIGRSMTTSESGERPMRMVRVEDVESG